MNSMRQRHLRSAAERCRRVVVELDKIQQRAVSLLPATNVSAVGCYFQRNVGDCALGEATVAAGRSLGFRVSRHPLSQKMHRLSRRGVVLGGGGILTPHFRNALSAVSEQVRSHRIPCSLMGLSGEFGPDDLGDTVVSMLQGSSFVGVRDSSSAVSLAKIGRTDAVVHPDLAFSLRSKLKATLVEARQQRTVGFNVLPVMMAREGGKWSPVAKASPWFKRNFPVQANNLPLVGPGAIAVIESLIGFWLSDGYRVRHVPFAEEDAQFAREVFSSLPIEFMEPTMSVAKTFQRVAECNEFIAMRFHSAVFSLMAGVPTKFLSYAPKGHLLWEDLKLSRDLIVRPEDWVLDPSGSIEKLASSGGVAVEASVLQQLEDEAQQAARRAFEPFLISAERMS